MASDYRPDRWRDRSIIAQASAKAAVELVSRYPETFLDDAGNPQDPAAQFVAWHNLVFDNTMLLAGDEPAPIQPTAGDSDQPRSRQSFGGGELPYANTQVKFGKFKGMSISEIDAAMGDDGKSGRSWLEWAAQNVKDDFHKKAFNAYLDATSTKENWGS